MLCIVIFVLDEIKITLKSFMLDFICCRQERILIIKVVSKEDYLFTFKNIAAQY